MSGGDIYTTAIFNLSSTKQKRVMALLELRLDPEPPSDARVYGHTTAPMHAMSKPSSPFLTSVQPYSTVQYQEEDNADAKLQQHYHRS